MAVFFLFSGKVVLVFLLFSTKFVHR